MSTTTAAKLSKVSLLLHRNTHRSLSIRFRRRKRESKERQRKTKVIYRQTLETGTLDDGKLGRTICLARTSQHQISLINKKKTRSQQHPRPPAP